MNISTLTAGGKLSEKKYDWKPETLPKEINQDLIAFVYDANLRNSRSVNATTLKRGEVRGGGKKPWQQKGTGRARHGSIRSPIWRGGGITFGPDGDRNHKVSVNKKQASSALASAIKSKEGNFVIADKLPVFEQPSTKSAASFVEFTNADQRVLVLESESNADRAKSFRNIANVMLVSAKSVSLKKIVDADVIIADKTALEQLESRMG